MSSSDNITALAENKVLILYTLSQIPNGLSNDGLYKIISSINDVNYFYFKEVLTDLLDSKLVGMFTKDEEDESVLKITSEGKNALSLTIDVLPGILKLKADNVFQKEFSSIADETSIIAEFIPRSENDYTIKCKVIEKNETIYLPFSEISEKVYDVDLEYIKDTNTIISGIMHSSERPMEIKALFQKFYHFIDCEEIENAEQILNQLKEKIGDDDSEIAGCNVKLKLLKVGRKR